MFGHLDDARLKRPVTNLEALLLNSAVVGLALLALFKLVASISLRLFTGSAFETLVHNKH